MEALGASERVISYLDAPAAPQIAAGAPLPSFSGHVRSATGSPSFPASQWQQGVEGTSWAGRCVCHRFGNECQEARGNPVVASLEQQDCCVRWPWQLSDTASAAVVSSSR